MGIIFLERKKNCQAFLKMSPKKLNISPGFCRGFSIPKRVVRSWGLPFEKGIPATQASPRLSF